MKRPYHLVTEPLSHDTITALRDLLAEAESGRLIGIAYAAMYRGRSVRVDAAGEAYRSPIFSLGMIAMLWDHLRRLARPED